MTDYNKVSNLHPNSGHVLLRVPQSDGSVEYELYYEREKRPTGERFVTWVESGSYLWAVKIAQQLNIPEEDVRIY